MASTTIVLFLTLFGVTLGYGIQDSSIVGIVNGHPVAIENARYMAALFEVVSWPDHIRLVCGGTIIHPKFILTAAQCLLQNLEDMVVLVGSTTLSTGRSRQPHEVKQTIPHELFNETNFGYDIGLIELASPLTFGPTVDMIHLADDTVLTPTNFIGNVSGWGSTKKTINSLPSEYLRQLEMSVRRSIDCEEHFDNFSPDKEICLWKIHSGPCIGDAGGPFTAEDLQIGVISRGNTCGHMPTVVVKVAPHLDWIDNVISSL